MEKRHTLRTLSACKDFKDRGRSNSGMGMKTFMSMSTFHLSTPYTSSSFSNAALVLQGSKWVKHMPSLRESPYRGSGGGQPESIHHARYARDETLSIKEDHLEETGDFTVVEGCCSRLSCTDSQCHIQPGIIKLTIIVDNLQTLLLS